MECRMEGLVIREMESSSHGTSRVASVPEYRIATRTPVRREAGAGYNLEPRPHRHPLRTATGPPDPTALKTLASPGTTTRRIPSLRATPQAWAVPPSECNQHMLGGVDPEPRAQGPDRSRMAS